MPSTPQADPLQNLRDIHLPDPGGFWPPAPGWWILAIIVLALLTVLGVWLWRRRRRNRWIHYAWIELDALRANAQRDSRWFGHLNALLKRCARERYPERQPDSLSGDAWAEFLLETRQQLDSQEVHGMVAAAWQAQPTIKPDTALAIARDWLRGQKC